MYNPDLAQMTIAIGGALAAAHGLAAAKPALVRSWIEKFPRHRGAAVALTLIDVIWVALLMNQSHLGFLDRYKPALVVLAPLTFYLVITHVDELLAPRALGGLLMLIPAPLLFAARMSKSALWFLPSFLAYALVIVGMVLMLSPYRFRLMMAWWLRDDARWRAGALAGLALGIALLALGWFAY